MMSDGLGRGKPNDACHRWAVRHRRTLRGHARKGAERPALSRRSDDYAYRRLRVQLDRFDDVVQFIWDGDRFVREGGFADTATAQGFVKQVLVGGVVGDGRRGVFQFVAGQHTDDSIARSDDTFAAQDFCPRDAGRRSWLAAEPAGSDHRFGIQDFLVGNLPDDAVAELQCSQAFLQVDGAIDFDRACQCVRFDPVLIHVVHVLADRIQVYMASVPANAAAFVQFIKRVGTGGIDDCQTRDAVDEAEFFQFHERLAKRAAVAQIATGDDDPVGDFPPQRFEHAEHDRLLAFQAKRIDRINQVDPQFLSDLANPDHRVIEIAGDLDRQGAVVERLAEFSVRNFAAADEDNRFHQAGRTAVQCQRRRGVPGARTGGTLRTQHIGVGDRGAHAVVFEAARRIHPFVLQVQLAGVHAHKFSDRVGLLQQRLAFADRHDFTLRDERQQFMETPHARKSDRIGSFRPPGFEFTQVFWDFQTVPVIRHIQKVAALGARRVKLAGVVARTAIGVDATLKRQIGLDGRLIFCGLNHGYVR